VYKISIVIALPLFVEAVLTVKNGRLAADIRNVNGTQKVRTFEEDNAFVIVVRGVTSSLKHPPIIMGLVTPARVRTVSAVEPMVSVEDTADTEFTEMLFATKLPTGSLATRLPDEYPYAADIFHVVALVPLKLPPVIYAPGVIELFNCLA
jgi:hypothetical protein